MNAAEKDTGGQVAVKIIAGGPCNIQGRISNPAVDRRIDDHELLNGRSEAIEGELLREIVCIASMVGDGETEVVNPIVEVGEVRLYRPLTKAPCAISTPSIFRE